MSKQGEGHDNLDDLARLRRKEDSLLVAKGFEPVEENLWSREGVLFSRGAALQEARLIDAFWRRRGSS